MSKLNDERMPDELHELETRLRDERPRMDSLELDRIKLRAMSAGRSTQKGPLMKSRLAITTMLVLGIFMSTTGAGLAITGGTVSQNAGQEASGGEEGLTLGQQEAPDQGNGPADRTEGEDQVLGQADTPGEASPAAQVEATGDAGDTLPFSGFLAIPLLLGGVVLLGSGLLLRRST
jgi:hypothetical protein